MGRSAELEPILGLYRRPPMAEVLRAMTAPSSTPRERVASLQSLLAERSLDALIVPSSDPHLSEYLPARWGGRAWASGFDGSVGTLIVTAESAALFADSRYWVQAERQLAGSGIELVKIATAASSDHLAWIGERVPAGGRVAVDGACLGLAAERALRSSLEHLGVGLVTDIDLLDEVWTDREGLPEAPLRAHRPPHAVRTRADNLACVRAAMAERGATHHLVSTVDDLAWILGVRGADVPFNPVFLGHLLIDAAHATLFVGEGKLDAALAAELEADGVRTAPYGAAAEALSRLDPEQRLLIDPARVTYGLVEGVRARLVEGTNPSTLAKSRKLPEELEHVRRAMEADGAAMCEFYAWFESALGSERITEITIDERLSAARAQQPEFVGLSFPTIAGYNANGALPHYRALPEAHATIEGDGLLLIDSGGQYLGGTTDITRVWPVGRIDERRRRDYSLVLKGTIALSRARFPDGTPGPMLDALARAPLWAESLEYGHGTGHGVGYYLNVHEGPQTISKAVVTPAMGMREGMITSIEPGLYREGRWGIRIENLVACRRAPADEFGAFLEFETLSLCPIDTRLVEPGLLTAEEVRWLDDYHAEVRSRLSPRVEGAAADWLERRTRPLGG
jgi:Xaa-Pro aminopeptidase